MTTERPNPLMTYGLIVVIFALNVMILAYAIHITGHARHEGAHTPIAEPAATSAFDSAAPIVSGLHNKHPLSQRTAGEVLLGVLNCDACHDGAATRLVTKTAPDLSNVAARVSPDYLRRFIAEPAGVHPGTTMPNVMASKSDDERADLAEALTQFLATQGAAFARSAVDPDDATAGGDLFARVGCVACHPARDASGVEVPAAGLLSLGHIPEKYGLDGLAEFLFQPLAFRPSGHMPDMTLSRAESRAIASFLMGTAAPAEVTAVGTDRIAEGRAAFADLGCVSCHAIAGIEPTTTAPAWSEVDPTAGCLSNSVSPAPFFGLDGAQRASIRAALSAPLAPLDDETRIDVTLTGYNCIACHVRDEYGGVAASRDPLFTTSEPSLGNEARIPPPLTAAGAKLQTEWIRAVLFDARSIRHYMDTRMPQFGETNLAALPDLLARTDVIAPIEVETFKGEDDRRMRDAGRALVGDKGLNCINCHGFNGHPSPGFDGLDLITSIERLEPSWFRAFMLDPNAHRPGMTMPNYWPGGEAVQTEILDGDTDAQLDALWHYLLLGRSAADPPGIRAARTDLAVSDRPRLYRGRSRIAGFRGIAVGFPGGLNYAFDAERGVITGVWRGGFVRVNWSGQGAGDFNPAARAIDLPKDLGVVALADRDAPWPPHPVMTDEAPVNPDPLYARRHGYRFRGYAFDGDDVPTLMYAVGDVTIDDRTVAEDDVLVRTLTFDAPAPATLWMRPLTGAIERRGDAFATGGVTLTVRGGATHLRAAGEGEHELLVEIGIGEGQRTVTIRYALD